MMGEFTIMPALRAVVTRDRPTLLQYGIALSLFGVALALTLLLRPWIMPSPFPFFFAATVFSACVGGIGPGLTSTACSSISVLRFFLPALFDVDGGLSTSTAIRFGSFVTVSLFIAALGAALRSSLRTSEANLEALRVAEVERAALFAREHASRAEAEAARARFAFLAEASTLLDGSLDYPTTLASVACLAVPHIGDWCIIDMAEPESEGATAFVRLAVAHADPAQRTAAQKLKLRYPPRIDDEHGAAKVVRTGDAEAIPDVSSTWLKSHSRDKEHLELLRTLGFHSYMCVPIAARGRILGAITFVRGEAGRPYDGSDLALAKDLAHRAAMAIDTARLYNGARAGAGGV